MPTERLGVEPRPSLRSAQRSVDVWVENNTRTAKELLRLSNLGAANMDGDPLTAGGIVRAAWQASITTDGSLIGRARSVVHSMSKVANGVEQIVQRTRAAHVTVARADALRARETSAATAEARALPQSSRRLLDEVDAHAPRPASGFEVPEEYHVLRDHIVGVADWSWWYDEIRRVGTTLHARHAEMHAHAEVYGTLPRGPVAAEHRTGYGLLDVNVPPSVLGDAIRSLVPMPTRHRRLEARAPELHGMRRALSTDASDTSEPRSMISSVIDAFVSDRDPIDAAVHALEHNDHHTPTRRLFEMNNRVGRRLMRTTAELASSIFGSSTRSVPTPLNDDPLREFGRWLVYDVALCYLYPPSSERATSLGDGTFVTTHYSDRACFPMIPFYPSDMSTFNEAYDLGPDFTFASLEYTNACNSDVVKALIGPMMGDLVNVGFISAPYGGLLRFAEGIDSIRNLALTGLENTTEAERGAAIVCGLAQFGGVLWISIVLLVMGVALICSPLCGLCCLSVYRRIRRRSAANARRNRAIDKLLTEFGDVQGERGSLLGDGA